MTGPGRRVLVTGASGFIARRCLPLLQKRGFEVHAVSRSASGSLGTWHACDLLEARDAETLIDRLRPSHLLHLAWTAQPGEFWTSPENARWAESGARLASRFYAQGGVRAVGAGSCAEYGSSATPCIEDATPIAPATPYGKAKDAMRRALAAAADGRGSWSWGRIFSPYGPGEPRERFIPSVIGALLDGRPLACSDGRQVRDFIYVDDVAHALVELLDSRAQGVRNIGTGRGSTLREAAFAIAAELGGGELIQFGARARAAQDDDYVVADMARMREDPGWAPSVPLEEGLRKSIAAAREEKR